MISLSLVSFLLYLIMCFFLYTNVDLKMYLLILTLYMAIGVLDNKRMYDAGFEAGKKTQLQSEKPQVEKSTDESPLIK